MSGANCSFWALNFLRNLFICLQTWQSNEGFIEQLGKYSIFAFPSSDEPFEAESTKKSLDLHFRQVIESQVVWMELKTKKSIPENSLSVQSNLGDYVAQSTN